MKRKIRIRGVKLGKPAGGTIRCGACGQLLGYLNQDCAYAYLHLLCRCGTSGYLELSRGSSEPAGTGTADRWKGQVCCVRCGRPLFFIGARARGYAFKVRCACGRVYDNRRDRRRDVYRELILEMGGLHKNGRADAADAQTRKTAENPG